MANIQGILANLTRNSVARGPVNPVDEGERKALAQTVYDSKASLLESRINLGNEKVHDIDGDLKTAPSTVQNCGSTIANPQRAALEAQKKEQAEVIAQATKELQTLRQQNPTIDSRSTQTLENELRDIKLATAELAKDSERLDNKKLDREIQLEMAKPTKPQACGSPGSSGPDQIKINQMNADKLKNADDIKVAMQEIKEIQGQKATDKASRLDQKGYLKSKTASDNLDQTLKSLATRTGELSVDELDKMQDTMGNAMPYWKSYGANSKIDKLKVSMAALSPALRNQLNEVLGLNEVLTNSEWKMTVATRR